MNPRHFVSELRRRNVYKVAVAYAVVSWLLIQVATQVFPFFEVPNWAVRLVVLLLILGFPVALILSWAFELTPEGIKRESEVAHERSQTRHTGRRIVGLTIVVAVIAAGLFLFQLLRSKSAVTPQHTEAATGSAGSAMEIAAKIIAVLPFDNLSDDKSNAYFAEGIQDEILTRLSKIAALKVISRTSTQKYKSAPDNLREVGQQLGVANLLEGSVQKAGNAVHINVQLIKAATDTHLWAESYDRELQNIFAVEGEVAKAIADQLRAKLTGQEEQVIATKPTDNPEAYDAYLRGLAYSLKTVNSPGNALAARKYLKEAVRLDPKFALAWALLSYTDALGYRTAALQPTVALREETRQATETALTLQPNLGEAILAKGSYHYFCLRDYDTAVRYFDQARQLLPNSS